MLSQLLWSERSAVEKANVIRLSRYFFATHRTRISRSRFALPTNNGKLLKVTLQTNANGRKMPASFADSNGKWTNTVLKIKSLDV